MGTLKKYPAVMALLIAMVLWLSMRLSTDGMRLELGFDLVYQDLPVGTENWSAWPRKVVLKLEGRGYDLLRAWLWPNRKIEVNLAQWMEGAEEADAGFYLKIRDLRVQWDAQWGKRLRLQELPEDEVVFLPNWQSLSWKPCLEVGSNWMPAGFELNWLNWTERSLVGLKGAAKEPVMLELKPLDSWPGAGKHKLRFKAKASANEAYWMDASDLLAEVEVVQMRSFEREVEVEAVGFKGLKTQILPSKVKVQWVGDVRLSPELETMPFKVRIYAKEGHKGVFPVRIECEAGLTPRFTWIDPHEVEGIQWL